MAQKVLLITPPFTQLNTPYPATCYIKGFLDSQNIDTYQCDLSIELFNTIFTKKNIARIFNVAKSLEEISFLQIWNQREEYINKVDTVIRFLKKHETTAAYQILHPSFLPKAHRFEKMEEDLSWAFGNLGILDKAKHIATLFIEELGDFIKANVDEFFSFTKYAEKLSESASSFDQIDEYLSYETTLIENELLILMGQKMELYNPTLVCFTIPFPGNLFAALRCSQFLKTNFPEVKIVFGGGYCNTELRSLNDIRIFKYVDFITLDNGEAPLLKLIKFLDCEIEEKALERTFLLKNNQVYFQNKTPNTVFKHRDLPAPSYKDLHHNSYLSFLDVMNPMHRLWSDGRWNKLTISLGCYWSQCTFCDVSLPYINDYEITTADKIIDKIISIIKETGTTGFHFVDEAAPPKILRALANKLIERKVYITWWTNIRFEKTFSAELCELLAKSGCIAITGGLEVASDRLLAKMKKGVDIEQVARVTNNFANANVMVHAYLMYGFPTETDLETVNSLEVVRQLFANGCIHSAFWHQFSTTVHSPIGKNPDDFGISILGPKFEGFAENDLHHEDLEGTFHSDYNEGLNLALNNYLNGLGLENEIQDWFDFEIEQITIPSDLIENAIAQAE